MSQTLRQDSLLDHGKYRIIRVLGQGGFGITYLAEDITLDKEVAIKEFFPKDFCEREGDTSHVSLGNANTAEFIDRLKKKFLKEARNIAKFDNPGIIRIHAAFEENNTAYYVMDYVEGKSLSAIVKDSGPVQVAKAIEYIIKVGEALEYVHRHKINHLDIKPANVIIRKKNDAPILIDFGLSKQYDEKGHQTSTTPTGISHGFAPVEQYKSEGMQTFSPQTDLYSLAATLYYICTGIVPPQAMDLIDSDLQFPETVPEQIRPVITKAMSVSKHARHETIRDFINDLRNPPEIKKRKEKVSKQESGTAEDSIIAVDIVDLPEKDGDKIKMKGSDSNDGHSKKIQSDIQSSVRQRNSKFPIVLIVVIIGIIVGFALVWFLFFNTSNEGQEHYEETDSTLVESVHPNVQHPTTVDDMPYRTSLGNCRYTGEVNADGIPDGLGKAIFTDGTAKSYEGEWVNGIMEGKAKYVLKQGDTFDGIFKNNEFFNGRYDDVSAGEYFVGDFRNKQPYKGNWYDAKGKIVGTVP